MARMSVDERRAALIDAAVTVMSRDGVAGATTRAIVAEAGMQIGVFHYCFRSKDELVLEVMRAISQRSYEAVGEVLARRLGPEEMIRATVDAYWEHIEENPLEHLLTYELTQFALRQPDEGTAAIAQYDSYITGMEELIAAVAQLSGFTWRSPVDVEARFVLAAIEGITFQWLVHRDREGARRLLDHLADYLVAQAGLLATASD